MQQCGCLNDLRNLRTGGRTYAVEEHEAGGILLEDRPWFKHDLLQKLSRSVDI